MEIIEEITPDFDVTTDPCPPVVIYFADEGEKVWDIAKRYSVTPDSIMLTNKLDSESLKKGQKICIFK